MGDTPLASLSLTHVHYVSLCSELGAGLDTDFRAPCS
jgi:hypothetical protein